MPGISVSKIPIPFRGAGGINWSSYWTTQFDAWQNEGDDVYIAGQPVSTYNRQHMIPDLVSPPAGGCVVIERGHAIRQNGYINSFSVDIFYRNGAVDWQFKLFRWNGEAYECVASQSVPVPFTGNVSAVKTFTLATPILAQEGDIPGLFLPFYNALFCTGDTPLNGAAKALPVPKRNSAGNIALGGTDAFETNASSKAGDVSYYFSPLTLFGGRPFAVFIGDSIIGGGNNYVNGGDGRNWRTDQESSDQYHTPGGSPGDQNLSIPYRLSTRMPSNFKYQNFGLSGSHYYDLVATPGPFARAMLANPKALFIHCGINDIFAGQTWEQIEGHLDTIRTALPEGTAVYLNEILPWSGVDAKAIITRTFNANYATYCATYGWTLIKCHDQMGVIRESTGELDTLNPAYTVDGVHVNDVGADVVADIMASYFHL